MRRFQQKRLEWSCRSFTSEMTKRRVICGVGRSQESRYHLSTVNRARRREMAPAPRTYESKFENALSVGRWWRYCGRGIICRPLPQLVFLTFYKRNIWNMISPRARPLFRSVLVVFRPVSGPRNLQIKEINMNNMKRVASFSVCAQR